MKESDTGLSKPSQWDLIDDAQKLQKEAPLMVWVSPLCDFDGSPVVWGEEWELDSTLCCPLYSEGLTLVARCSALSCRPLHAS